MSGPNVNRPGLCEMLGVLGWADLDPLLLGALATEAPVLLLGSHGTAKTLLVERVACALDEEFRHYNASLVNYDDLVGIPLPTDDGGLRFVGTRGAIWGAGFVFFDEVNRCRPDLQNKLFPIVHEKRIAGTNLDDLRYRWAAMNPPSGGYLGAEMLDIALADRFPVIARVPEWAQLSRTDRERIASGECDEPHPDAAAIVIALLDRIREEILILEAVHREPVAAYTVVLADLLAQSGIRNPPAFVAIMPPIVAESLEPMSTANLKPCSAAALFSSASVTPAPITAVPSTGSISSSRMREVQTITSVDSDEGTAPPTKPVPPPRGISTTPCRSARRTKAEVSATLRGRTTARADPDQRPVQSCSYATIVSPVSTESAPNISTAASTKFREGCCSRLAGTIYTVRLTALRGAHLA